jgi:5-methylthioadenosine/S-adenosylhomocysteine deaminase
MRTRNILSRRSLLQAAGGAALIGALPRSPAWSQPIPSTVTLPGRGEMLIRGASVISVDPAIGTLSSADIHIRGGQILAVGANLAAPGADIIEGKGMVAMPGFVDTHWHMWGSLGRTFVTDARTYMRAKNTTAPFYTPEDFYHSISLGLAEAVDAGITGVLNFSHNTRSPKHADGEIKAHGDCGVRSLYCYGNPDEPPRDAPMDLADVARAKRQWFADAGAFDGLAELGMAVRGPVHSDQAVWDKEMEFCLKNGFKHSYHAGQSTRSTISAVDFRKRGYLSNKTVLAHYLYASEADRQAMKETGASLSFSTMGEYRGAGDALGDPRDQILQMKNSGVVLSFSVDGNSIAPVNMFESMRTVWRYGVPWKGSRSEGLAALTLTDVLRMATLGGAEACGWDKICGSITPGKRADIILVRTGDLNMTPFFEIEAGVVKNATPANVDTVLIDGRVMKRGGKIVGLDVERIKRNASEAAGKLYEAAQKVPG